MAKPLRGREQGTEWRANLNKGRSHPWRKSNKHRGKNGQTHQQQKEGRGIAAQAQREEAVPMGKTQTRPSRSMIQATMWKDTQKGEQPQKRPPTPTAGKVDRRRQAQSSPANRREQGEDRRASKAQRSGARRKSQQPHKHKHDPSYSVGGNWGRDGEQT